MPNIINNYSSTITTIFNEVIAKYEKAVQTIKNTEAQLNDLNHEAEFSSPKDMYKGYLVYKQIRELRIQRRAAKEEVELLKDTYEYFKGSEGQRFKNNVQQLQGESTKLRAAQKRRTYSPRVRED